MNFQLFFEESKVTDRFAPYELDQDEPYVLVDVDKVDKAWRKGEQQYIASNGEGGIAGRYERFGTFWNDGNTIIAPMISVKKNGTVEFTNGRHRFAYFRDIGIKQMPVSMDQEDLAIAKKHGLVVKVLRKKPGIREFQGKTSGKS